MANPLVLNSHGQDETGDMSPEKSPPDKDRTPAQERVVVDPSVKLGQPVLQSSGRLVGEVLERLAEATSFDELLKADPALSLAGLKAALKCAADLVRERHSLDHVSPEQLEKLMGVSGEMVRQQFEAMANAADGLKADIAALREIKRGIEEKVRGVFGEGK